MKNKLTEVLASTLIKVGNLFDGNVSPCEYYQPAKPNKKSK